MRHEGHRRMTGRQRLAALFSLLLLFGTSTLLVGGTANAATTLTGSPYDGTDGTADAGVTFHQDQPSGNTDNVYVQGATEDALCPATDFTHSAPPNDDITSYAVASARGTNGHVFLYLGWTRQTNQGTATIEYELNQSTTGCGNGVNPVRTENDLRFIYNFHGGTVDSIQQSRWHNGAWTAETDVVAPHEASISDPDQLFGEAVIDLTAAAVFQADSCTTLASAFARSRSSSQSQVNELKDFVLPQNASISNCGSVTMHKTDDKGHDLAGASFGLYTDLAHTTLATNVTGDNPCTTDANGDCSWTNVQPATYYIHEVSGPANNNYTTDGRTATVQVVAGTSTAASFTFIDPRKVGDLIIHKAVEDANGDPVAVDPTHLNGAAFTVLNPDNSQAKIWASSANAGCTITNDLGYCTVEGLATGDYKVHETAAPAGTALTAADANVTITTGTVEEGATEVTMTNKVGQPAITVEKSGPTQAHEGDTVTYSFKVTNSGNVDLTDVSVTDDVLGSIGTIPSLAVGASTTLTKDYVVPAGTSDITNTVTACGNDPLEQQVCDTDQHTLDRIHPAISIVKTVDNATPHPGDTVTFSYLVTNTGDTTLFQVAVTDDILGAIGTIPSLGPGGSATLTKTEVVSESTPLTNVGTATGTDILGTSVSAHDDATIQVVLGLVITKPSVAPALAKTGASIALELQWGAGLMVIGILLTIAARRRLEAQRVDESERP